MIIEVGAGRESLATNGTLCSGEENALKSSLNDWISSLFAYREVSRPNVCVDECLTSSMCWNLFRRLRKRVAFHLNEGTNQLSNQSIILWNSRHLNSARLAKVINNFNGNLRSKLTSMCSHVTLQQAWSIKRFPAHFTRQKVSFTSRRPLLRWCDNRRVHQITWAAVARRRVRIARNRFPFVFGVCWRWNWRNDVGDEWHGQVQRRICWEEDRDLELESWRKWSSSAACSARREAIKSINMWSKIEQHSAICAVTTSIRNGIANPRWKIAIKRKVSRVIYRIQLIRFRFDVQLRRNWISEMWDFCAL